MGTSKRKKVSWKRMLKHKLFRKRNFISFICLILSVIFLFFLLSVNLLPNKYFLLIGLFLFIFDLLGIIFINVHKKLFLKILGSILIFISIVGDCIGLYYLSTTKSFINKSFTSKSVYLKNTYYVLGKSSNHFKETDISGDIALYKEMIYYDKALDKLNSKYSVKEVLFDDIGSMFDSFNNNMESFVLMDKSSYEIVFSLSTSLNKADYDILYEFDVFTKRKSNENTSTDRFNVFVGGTDFAGLMDFNMIATVNMNNHRVLLTSIPRDYYIEVPGKDGRKDKLSFMNAYGPDTNREALEDLLGISIDYSVIVDTNILVTIVDYVGGIEFCSDYDFTTTHAMVLNTYNDIGKKLTIHKGCQTLDGIETLTVARERNAFPGRDRVRQKNCQKILLAIFKKLMNADTLLHYNETLNTVASVYDTDVPKELLSKIAKDALINGNLWKIDVQSLDGEDTHDFVHLSSMIDWVMIPDYSTVELASQLIHETLG